MSGERWLPVVGWEGLYSVSDLGRVRSEERNIVRSNGAPQRVTSRILKTGQPDGAHYPSVSLSREGKPVTHMVHAIVLTAFRGRCPSGMESRHIDGQNTNTKLENLQWSTHLENVRDKVAHGTQPFGERQHNAKLTAAKAWAIKQDIRPQNEIAAEHGVDPVTVRDVKAGRRWVAAIHELLTTSTTNERISPPCPLTP